MNTKFASHAGFLSWFIALLLVALVAGCGGGGGGGRDPILGGDGIAVVAPMVTFVSPPANAIGVPVNTRIVTATFTKAMDPATLNATSFTLACPVGAAQAGGVAFAANGNVATLTLTNTLPASTLCTATITTAAKDLAGHALAAAFTWSFTTGVVLDVAPPTVTGTVNANGATSVAINTHPGATFSEAMAPATITNNVTLRQTVSGAAVAGAVSYSGVSAAFTPSSNLAANTNYTVTIRGGVGGVTDLAGNPMASDFVWSWTTGATLDTTPPTVTGTVNANGATNVAINTHPGATFSEAMDHLTITNANFTLRQTVSGTAVAGLVSYSGVSAVFVPSSNLAANTNYTVTIKGGVGGVADLAGNPMASDYILSWTTGAALDTTPPTVTGTVNANGATNVAINTHPGATFSEAMDNLTITNANFTLRQTVSGTAVAGLVSYSGVNAVFIPSSALAANTNYTVTIRGGVGGVADLAGNPMTSDYVLSWTTGAAADSTAPTVIGTVNANGATNVAINTHPGATFSEAMDHLTITNANFTLRQTVSGTAVAGLVSYSGVNAIFAPSSNLAANTNYTVTIKGGVGGGADLAGNPMLSDYVWSWTTGAALDTIAPTVIATVPLANATGVATNTLVNATFSEAMDALTISTASFRLTCSGTAIAGTVGYAANGNLAALTPASALPANSSCTATISADAKDLAGNPMVSPFAWTFTTGAAPIPVPLIALGSVSTYGTFGGTAGMTNTGALTLVNGDIGTIATGTSAITGFHDTSGDIYTQTPANIGAVNGKIYTCTNSTTGPTAAGPNAAACALATQARLDAQTAYLALAALPPGANPGANLGGKTLAPGTYTAPSGSFMVQGSDLTLDAQGDANAVWVFQMATTLLVGGPGAAAPQNIILAGGAQAKNVFWQVGSAATINAGGGGTMIGTIIAQAGVAFSTAGNVAILTLNGRALSLGASVTMVNTVINVPAP